MKSKAFLLFFLLSSFSLLQAADKPLVRVETERTSLIYQVADNERLYQGYLGKELNHDSDIQYLPQGTEIYLIHGMEDYLEPAIHIRHNDNSSPLLLKYVDHSSNAIDNEVNETVTTLRGNKYPVIVKLHYVAYGKEDIVHMFIEINHEEKKPVILYKYTSSMLHLNSSKYSLTEFSGDWAHEINVTERELAFGKKVIDTRLGIRANMFVSPFFQLALDNPSQENAGEVLVGTIGWTGNFRFTFEVDNKNRLRIISGIDLYDSEYSLPAKEVFRTPDFYFTYSAQGKGEAGRNFRDWARSHQVKNGNDTRMTSLGNWESTYFDLDENKLIDLMDEATRLGVDMFLLDDGWFANRYPRSSDHQGLSNREETADKLPNGVGRLAEETQKKGIKFSVWIEPEVVNSEGELYEKRKDQVIHPPNRDRYYFRNQMMLDLSNPKVQDHVFDVVDNLMTKYPDTAFFKRDCSSPITNICSMYLKGKQPHLYVDYVCELYKVLDRIEAKYPGLPMMLCADGGRCSDYKALKYFTGFWPGDNTGPIERLFTRWGYLRILPDKTLCAHVTIWNRGTSIRFRIDVAMMCKLRFDIKPEDMDQNEHLYCDQVIKDYSHLRSVILEDDLYHLVSPYGSNHTSSMFVGKDKKTAAVSAFDIHSRCAEKTLPVRLQGLNADKKCHVKGINMMSGNGPSLRDNNQVFSGEYLMNVGLDLFITQQLDSRLIEVTEE